MQTIALKTVNHPVISLAHVAKWVTTAASRQRTRAALRKLDDAALRDIGLSYREANNEARKPFFI